MAKTSQDILDFWFSETTREKWWDKDADFDARVRREFAAIHDRAAAGKLSDWEKAPESALALTIALDQFPRNMFRDTPRAFATDARARQAANAAIGRGFDLRLADLDQRFFFYLPLEHSEALADQKRCVELVRERCNTGELLKFALAHHDIIARFGRFPHRNPILGRRNTPEEEEYLKDPKAGF